MLLLRHPKIRTCLFSDEVTVQKKIAFYWNIG
jgi:hypothetical protein